MSKSNVNLRPINSNEVLVDDVDPKHRDPLPAKKPASEKESGKNLPIVHGRRRR